MDGKLIGDLASLLEKYNYKLIKADTVANLQVGSESIQIIIEAIR